MEKSMEWMVESALIFFFIEKLNHLSHFNRNMNPHPHICVISEFNPLKMLFDHHFYSFYYFVLVYNEWIEVVAVVIFYRWVRGCEYVRVYVQCGKWSFDATQWLRRTNTHTRIPSLRIYFYVFCRLFSIINWD